MIQRSWHSGDNIEEEDPKAERNVEDALQRDHLAQDHPGTTINCIND